MESSYAHRWKNLGVLLCNGSSQVKNAEFQTSHFQIPTGVHVIDKQIVRVFFAYRETSGPLKGCSQIAYIDLDESDPTKILEGPHRLASMSLGPLGQFDEHGIMPQCIISDETGYIFYYNGWSRRYSFPYSNWVGVANSDASCLEFEKASDAPILDRCSGDIFSATGLFVVKKGPGSYFGWYASGLGWFEHDARLEEVYRIRSCTSDDGYVFNRDLSEFVLPEQNFSPECTTRPTVYFHGDMYHMMFCYRGIKNFRNGSQAYELGYAVSHDLKNWERMDNALDIGHIGEGYDDVMRAYPNVVSVYGDKYLFYNGNGFGASGIFLAKLE